MTVRDDHERQPVSDHAGDPGDTGIEIEEAGGNDARRPSGPHPGEDVPLRAPEHWGQGPSGPPPYADSGPSELATARGARDRSADASGRSASGREASGRNGGSEAESEPYRSEGPTGRRGSRDEAPGQ